MGKCNEMRKDKKLGVSLQTSKGFIKYVYGDTIDELIEGLELLKDGKFINNFLLEFPNLSEDQLERLDLVMPQTDEAEQISKYACKRKKVSNTTDFEDALIKLKAGYQIKEFAKSVEGANIQKLEDAIIESKEIHLMSDFVEEIKGADLLKFKKAIFETKDAYCMARFCVNFQKEDGIIEKEELEEIEKIVIESENCMAIRVFASRDNGANVEKLQEAIIKTKDALKILQFARYVKGADINKLREAIFKAEESKNKKLCIALFIEIFGDSPKPNFFKKIKSKFF